MNKPSTIQLLRTEPHPCSYLDGAIATTEFISPGEEIDLGRYQAINDLGFRRSGAHFYRPACQSCSECRPLRVPVGDFRPSKSQRRILKKNSSHSIRIETEPEADKYFSLYQNYILERHAEGDMYPPDRKQFDNFICCKRDCTRFIEFYADDSANNLIMVAVCDLLADGISAIYSFFDPKYSQLSLGSYAVLAEIDIAKQIGLSYLYMGYWIADSKKMNYKNRFRPCQILEKGEWRTLPF